MNKTLALILGFFGLATIASQKDIVSFDIAPEFSQDVDTLARTIWGEARGDGELGMTAVANVIMNRFKLSKQSIGKRRQFGATVAEICQKKWQFSVWNVNDPNLTKILNVTDRDLNFHLALNIARKAVLGDLDDITGGSDHYHTKSIQPYWSKGKTPIASVGSHKFFQLA